MSRVLPYPMGCAARRCSDGDRRWFRRKPAPARRSWVARPARGVTDHETVRFGWPAAGLADEDALSLGELAERTFTHQSSVSVVVGRLVDRGLVRRERSTVDDRRLEVTLTRAGRILAGRAPAAAQGRLISGLERLDPGDRRVLARTLGCLLGEMGIGQEAAAMFFEDDSASDRHVVKRTVRRSRAETP